MQRLTGAVVDNSEFGQALRPLTGINISPQVNLNHPALPVSLTTLALNFFKNLKYEMAFPDPAHFIETNANSKNKYNGKAILDQCKTC